MTHLGLTMQLPFGGTFRAGITLEQQHVVKQIHCCLMWSLPGHDLLHYLSTGTFLLFVLKFDDKNKEPGSSVHWFLQLQNSVLWHTPLGNIKVSIAFAK